MGNVIPPAHSGSNKDRQLVDGLNTTVNLNDDDSIAIDVDLPASGPTTPITVTDETVTIAGSRRLVNGTNTTVNTSVAGQIKIDASGGRGSPFAGDQQTLSTSKSNINYTVLESDGYFICTPGTPYAINLNLPSIAGLSIDRVYVIQVNGTGTLNINADGADLIDSPASSGDAIKTISPVSSSDFKVYTLASNKSTNRWYIVSGYGSASSICMSSGTFPHGAGYDRYGVAYLGSGQLQLSSGTKLITLNDATMTNYVVGVSGISVILTPMGDPGAETFWSTISAGPPVAITVHSSNAASTKTLSWAVVMQSNANITVS